MDPLFYKRLFLDSAGVDPPLDWLETKGAHILKVDLPGWKKEKIQVYFQDGNVLRISGDYGKDEEKVPDGKWLCLERSRNNFAREFQLPDNVRGDDIKASLENGILTVIVSKKPPAPKPGARKINISSRL